MMLIFWHRLGEDIEELIENDDRKDEDVFEKVEGLFISNKRNKDLLDYLYIVDDGLDYEDFDQKNNHFYNPRSFHGVNNVMHF